MRGGQPEEEYSINKLGVSVDNPSCPHAPIMDIDVLLSRCGERGQMPSSLSQQGKKHPSMWEQQAKQSIPDIPLPIKTLEAPRGNFKGFPSQMIIPPVNTGFPTIGYAL